MVVRKLGLLIGGIFEGNPRRDSSALAHDV